MKQIYGVDEGTFTLQSNKSAFLIFAGFFSFCALSSWLGVIVIATPGDAKALFLTIPFSLIALIASWLAWMAFRIIRHPNRLTVNAEGVVLERLSTRNFVAWRDMERVASGGAMFFFPDYVAILLKPDAALRRQRESGSYAAPLTVNLGNCWKTDRWYNGSQIAKAIEAQRLAHTR